MSGNKELQKAIDLAKVIELSMQGSKIYKFKTYPFGERGTKLDFSLTKEITESLVSSINKNFPKFDYVVSPEPGGHLWGLIVSYELKKPVIILRLEPSYEKGEKRVPRRTGYYQHDLYFSNFKKGDRVLVLDDIISTGGTIKTILNSLKDFGVKIIGVQTILAKSDNYKDIEKEFSLKIKFLAKDVK